MSFELSPIQVSLLWRLLFIGETPIKSKVKPNITVKQRDELRDLGLIKYVKDGRAERLELTEEGWAWANENLNAPFSLKSNNSETLEALLLKLKNFMERKEIALYDMLITKKVTEDVEEKVLNAYKRLSKGEWDVNVRLADMRNLLSDMERKDFDELLLKMQQDGALVLYKMENPTDISNKDKDAAIYIGDNPRHIVYMGDNKNG